MITKPQCRILWSLLSDGQRQAFKFIARIVDSKQGEYSVSDVEHLCDLELIYREPPGRFANQEVALLTENGKKLARVLRKK